MLARANHTRETSHENSSADCTLRPRGVGPVGSTRCMTASSGPTCCGGPGKKCERTEGRAGVDGVSIEDVERDGVEAYLSELAADLKAQGYRPQPVLRVEIPKPDGRTRPLGIPTVRDRVVQQACKIVIEPLFEANFLPCSYGYRPKRSAGQAVLAVKEALVWRWWVRRCRHRELLRQCGPRDADGSCPAACQ